MWRKDYFSFIVVAFISGAILAQYLSYKATLIALTTQVILCLIIYIFRHKLLLISSSSILISIAAGIIGYNIYHSTQLSERNSILSKGISTNIQGVIVDKSKTKKGLVSLTVKVKEEKITLYIKGENINNYNYGDSIFVKASTNPIGNFTSDFDYRKYMHEKGIFSTAFINLERYPNSIKVKHNRHIKLRHKLRRWKDKLNTALEARMGIEKQENIAIIKAFTTGERSDILPQQKEDFQKSGAMHILALSGLHIGIIYKIIKFLLSFLGNYTLAKRLKSTISLILLWGFAMFTGMGVSIVRAVLMATIYEVTPYNEGSSKTLPALSLTALIIITITPSAIFSLSFQLSFAAMLGISIVYPHLSKIPLILNYKYKIFQDIFIGIRNIAFISISCQIFTAPIIYFTFHTFSDLYLLTNILVMPLSSVIISLIIMCLPLSFIVEYNSIFHTLLDYSLSILNYLIKIISEI